MRVADQFAGFGGFSTGADLAGLSVVWAANHNPTAVYVHQTNHPGAIHLCQDLHQANWHDMPQFDLLLAGPSCPGFSSAGQPGRARSAEVRKKHDDMRADPWAVISCVEVTRPPAVIVENVPLIRSWPLLPSWLDAFTRLGYTVTIENLLASRCGAPQRRNRVFFSAVRHGSLDLRNLEDDTETPIGPCIDWDSAGDGKGWLEVGAASDVIKARIAKGRRNHGRRFLTQHVTGHRGVGLDEPIRTITTKAQWNVVDGDRYRSLSKRETARAMGFPDSFVIPADVTKEQAVRGLGNAVPPPMARRLIERIAG